MVWFAQVLAWLLAKLLLLVFTRTEVQGRENLDRCNTKAVFASNHVSDLDPVLMRTCLPLFSRFAPLFVVARKHKDYTWSGWKSMVYRDGFFQSLGAFPALKGTRDYAKSLKLFAALGRTGSSIVIFTGGKQQTPVEPVKIRGGTGYLCWATNSPIVPVAIEGTFDFGVRAMLRRQHIVVRYGEPVQPADVFTTPEPSAANFRNASNITVRRIEAMRKDIREQTLLKATAVLEPAPVRSTSTRS